MRMPRFTFDRCPVPVGAVPILCRGPLLGSPYARGAVQTTIRSPAEKSESGRFGRWRKKYLDLIVRFLAGGLYAPSAPIRNE